MSKQLTTIKALCAAAGTPFYELSIGNSDLKLPLRRLNDIGLPEILAPYVCCGLLQDVHVFGRTFVYSRDDKVVFHCQSSQTYKTWGLDENVATFIDEKKSSLFTSYLEDECIFVGGMYTERYPHGWMHEVEPPNFGHFIFEFLNRLAIFEPLGLLNKLPVVVYDRMPERWIGFLELMGIPKERIIRVPIVDGPAYRKVWMSSSCHYRDTAGNYRFWGAGLHWLRARAFAGIGGPQLHKHRRIYLGRDGAKWRKIVNEEAVKQVLQDYGFEFVEATKLSAREQIEIISGADFVVTAAGAGGVLTHFAPEHCTIFLLAPPGAVTGPWGGLGAALFLRQIYERIEGEPVESPVRSNLFGVNEITDFKVDVDALRRSVETAIFRLSHEQKIDAIEL